MREGRGRKKGAIGGSVFYLFVLQVCSQEPTKINGFVRREGDSQLVPYTKNNKPSSVILLFSISMIPEIENK